MLEERLTDIRNHTPARQHTIRLASLNHSEAEQRGRVAGMLLVCGWEFSSSKNSCFCLVDTLSASSAPKFARESVAPLCHSSGGKIGQLLVERQLRLVARSATFVRR